MWRRPTTTPGILHPASNSVERGLLKVGAIIYSNQEVDLFKPLWNGKIDKSVTLTGNILFALLKLLV